MVNTFAYRIHTNSEITGEYIGGDAVGFAEFKKFAKHLIGKSVMAREAITATARRELRKYDQMGIGPLDIALWDAAGKRYEAPIYELLGGTRRRLPCYASTMSGDRNGGLDSPDAFAAFAEQCQSMGYHGFKLHIWDDYTVPELVETIRSVRQAVGPDMALMLDPACKLKSFVEAVKIGHACDEADFLWLEDPYRDGGVSAFGHRRLRTLIRTPLLQTEHVRGLEQHVNFVVAEGTDLVRVDPEYDAGITGAVKIAHASEGFGLDVEVHGPGPAQRHLMSAIGNTNYYEMCLVHPKTEAIGRPQQIYEGSYRDGLDAIEPDGCVLAPDGPGLGVAYDWNAIERAAVNHYVID